MSESRFDLIDLGPRPAASGLSPLDLALRAVRQATTMEALEAAITPVRAWPEGDDKAMVRNALRIQERVVHNIERAAVMTLTVAWPGLWRSLAAAIYQDGGTIVDHSRTADLGAPLPTVSVEEWSDISAEIDASERDTAQGLAPVDEHDDSPVAQPTPVQVPLTDLDERVASGKAATLHEALMQVVTEAKAAQPAATGGGETTTHAPTGPSVFDLPRNHPDRVKFQGASKLVPAATPTRTEVKAAIGAREIVVGAKAEATGVLLGWFGHGEHTRGGIIRALTEAELPAEWAPAARSAHAHAADALAPFNSEGRVLRAERGAKVRRSVIVGGVPRTYVARWTVSTPTHGQVGDKAGTVIMTAYLTSSGTLECEGSAADCARVREDFQRRVDAEAYPAGEVTYWLRGVMLGRFAAVRLGANWYVPAKHAADAERLCEALSRGWGVDWILPALPVATTDQLCAGLVRGLAGEADTVLSELETLREAARKENRSEIGPRAAAGLLGKLRDVYTRAKGYRELLGDQFTADIRRALESALAIVEPLCDDTAQRFAMMDLT